MAAIARSPLRVFTSVLFALWFRELKTRFSGDRLGWLWAILGPLAGVVIFTFMAGARGRDLMYGIDYPVFVLTGFVFFGIVTQSVLLGMGAIEANAGLFIYRQVKPFDVIIGRVMQTALIDFVILLLLLCFGAWLGYRVIPHDPLRVLALLLLTVAMAMGAALCTAVLAHRFQQAKKIVPLLMRPLFFISGVIFPLSAVPSDMRSWLTWNPLMHLLELLRNAWFAGFPLDADVTWLMVVWPTLLSLALGMLAYRSHRHALVGE